MTDTKQPEALYQEACQIALENPSLAPLTRRLRANGHDIGYTDVTPMLERMVAEGVISDYAGRQKEPVEHELRARIAVLEAENRALKDQVHSGCTRSHPHENMSAMCVLRTDIARLEHDAAIGTGRVTGLSKLIKVTPEMVAAAEEAYMPFGDMELAISAAIAQEGGKS